MVVPMRKQAVLLVLTMHALASSPTVLPWRCMAACAIQNRQLQLRGGNGEASTPRPDAEKWKWGDGRRTQGWDFAGPIPVVPPPMGKDGARVEEQHVTEPAEDGQGHEDSGDLEEASVPVAKEVEMLLFETSEGSDDLLQEVEQAEQAAMRRTVGKADSEDGPASAGSSRGGRVPEDEAEEEIDSIWKSSADALASSSCHDEMGGHSARADHGESQAEREEGSGLDERIEALEAEVARLQSQAGPEGGRAVEKEGGKGGKSARASVIDSALEQERRARGGVVRGSAEQVDGRGSGARGVRGKSEASDADAALIKELDAVGKWGELSGESVAESEEDESGEGSAGSRGGARADMVDATEDLNAMKAAGRRGRMLRGRFVVLLAVAHLSLCVCVCVCVSVCVCMCCVCVFIYVCLCTCTHTR